MIARLASLLLLLCLAMPASAHLTPNSEVRLDLGHTRDAAEIVIPMGELSYAIGRPLPQIAGPPPPVERAMLEAYLLGHVSARSPAGSLWMVRVTDIAVIDDGGAPDLRARLDLVPPAGSSPRVFDLGYSAVIDRVPNHFVLVVVRTDFDAGRLSDRPRMIGGLQGGTRVIRIDQGPGSGWRGFASAVALGMHHIAEGHDHLLFLIALLLPAPLIARAGRWRDYGGLRFTVRRLAAVVTAFTIGHSLTLIGGAFLGWQLPTRPVEILIAVSILISAIHAARPLFPGREAFVAGGFGLVHGMAFATLIGHFGLEPWQKAQSILGFNIGIELVQLAVVAAVVPPLLLAARVPSYRYVRTAGALFAGVAAIAWIAERAMNVENPIGRAIDTLLGHAPWIWLVLTIAAVAGALSRRGDSALQPVRSDSAARKATG